MPRYPYLTGAEQDALKERTLRGHSFRTIGIIHGRSAEGGRQLYYRAKRKLLTAAKLVKAFERSQR